MSTTTFPVFPRWHTQLASLAALLAVIVGDMVLAGWVFDIGVLKSILPGWVSMKPNAAVSFILIGIALLLTTRSPATFDLQHSTFFSRFARLFGLLASLLAGLIGLLTLSEYVFGWDFGIDQWLIREQAGMVGTSHPGRMAPETALCFVLLAAALWIASGSRRLRRSMLTSMILGLLVTTLALASILSYAMPVSNAYGWFGLTFMAMHTAITFTVLGAAVIAISWQPDILQWSLSRNTTAAFICGMAVLVFIGLNTNRSQISMKETSRQIERNEQAQADIGSNLIEVFYAHAQINGYIITGDERFLKSYLSAKAASMTKLDGLRRVELASAEPVHHEHFARIEAQTKAHSQWSRQIMDAPRTGMTDAARNNMIRHGEDLLENLHETIGQVESDHHQLTQQLKRESENLARSSYITVATGTFVSLLIFLAVIFRLNSAVNEWKRAEQEIIGSEERFHMLFDSIADAIFIYDTEGQFIQVNHTACERLSYSREELLQIGIANIYTPEHAAKLAERIKEALERGKFVFETALVCKDGSVIPAESNIRKIDYDGKPAILCVARDITERKRAEGALRESESKLRNLIETTSDWIWEVDENAVYTYASPQLRDMLGYEVAEVIGKTPFDLMPPEEAKRVADIFGPIVAAGKSFINLENTNLRKDGHPVVLETSGVPVIDSKGKFCGYRGIDRDITGRKRAEMSLRDSEARLQTIVENLTEGIAVSDLDGRLLHFNRAALETEIFKLVVA
ncbi:MAG: PAS domain S-box protein [Gallionella sp.]|nr:PAS domain S-box protein [Gallionella sp.]